MTIVVPIISTDTAALLRLSDQPSSTHIGYWRWSEDGSESYYLWELRSALLSLKKIEEAGSCGYTSSEADEHGGDMRAMFEAKVITLRQKHEAHESMPWPGEHCDAEMPWIERDRTARILEQVPVETRYCGHSWDRLNPGVRVGAARQTHQRPLRAEATMRINLNDRVRFIPTREGAMLWNKTHESSWASPGQTLKVKFWEFLTFAGKTQRVNLIARLEVDIDEDTVRSGASSSSGAPVIDERMEELTTKIHRRLLDRLEKIRDFRPTANDDSVLRVVAEELADIRILTRTS